MVIILGNAANVYLSKLWFEDKHKNTLALMMFLVFFSLKNFTSNTSVTDLLGWEKLKLN